MRQFTLNLDATQQRPVVALKNLTALLDTGAYIPVWTDDEEILVSGLGAKLIKKKYSIYRFRGYCSRKSVSGNIRSRRVSFS